MYLKSIEVQGFKSFANKIVFEFHNGITGIVGPNGSGKSNVADAVRWVLGEQSAKQLRGAKMEDVIFAGTQTRKPVGYAYVSITFDNSDKVLPVEYDEVTVTRKVFRSGESEYQINGHSCRLKDISELFYDTGIGKEGYSIIGQGQIDKILSGKPEDRRELFDEAAGIVKFKRRKAAAIKKLENEHSNLVRVNDILSELEKQVEPLKKQSEKAKEYLKLKDELKQCDVNCFLLETDRLTADLKAVSDKIDIAAAELEAARTEYNGTKAEYEAVEEKLLLINNEIDTTNALISNTGLEKQRLLGIENVYLEQIKTIEANNIHYDSRINDINKAISMKRDSILRLDTEHTDFSEQLTQYQELQASAEAKHRDILNQIDIITARIDENKNNIFNLLNEKSAVKANSERFKTMLEQYNIKLAELNSHIIKGKSEENAQELIIADFSSRLACVNESVNEITTVINRDETTTASIKENISNITAAADKLQQQYHREKSQLEALINITERYDGYGSSIKKLMELKSENSGIIGVIADIVKVEKRYETAIETALGAAIQNIVTDNENTAKGLISYLKENKLGRATFLPLSSVSGRNTLENEPCAKEPGVVGVANKLVRISFEYENLAKYLLGRVLVVDNIDNALTIARKYKYSLRIVTLEGEQLNPGGSMTGGAFKNSSNLLGRRREIDELKKQTSKTLDEIHSNKSLVTDLRKQLSAVRADLEANNSKLRELLLKKNTLQLQLSQAESKKQEIMNSYSTAQNNAAELESDIKTVTANINSVSGSLSELDSKNEASQKEIDTLQSTLEKERELEAAHLAETENIRIEYSSLMQKVNFSIQNRERIESEIAQLEAETDEIKLKISQTDTEISAKNNEIETVKQQVQSLDEQLAKCNDMVKQLKEEKEALNLSHKAFFEKREHINNHMNELDKECYRLNSQKEKLEEEQDRLTDYMWTEYELTYNYALELRNNSLQSIGELKKMINSLKASIKSLGAVNVNAIDEYKDVSERYDFLSTQHNDLIEAEASLTKIIDELDSGMRIQFEEKFKEIKLEFDKVFKELFGGGRGTIELVEGEDILEAGIVIISQPPGKKLQNMMQLSGGEKALTAISLLFAIQNLKPSPFCLLDEIEAALDDSNVGRYANYLHKLTKHTQFIVITHRRGTMAAADRLYGITMQEKGVSALVSVDLIENDLERNVEK